MCSNQVFFGKITHYFKRGFMKSVLILRYCHVKISKDSQTISPRKFEKQMAYLAKSGYKTLSLEQFLEFKKGKFTPPKKSLVITIDGGWRDIYIYAYPILKKFGLKANLFVATEWIDEASNSDSDFEDIADDECRKFTISNPRSVVCNWDELKKMKDTIEVASMTHTYRFDNIIGVKWHEEFEISRNLIEKYLGYKTSHLAWPDGIYTPNSVRTAKTMGYEALYTLKDGINLSNGECYEIRRSLAKNGIWWLKKKLFIYSSSSAYRMFGYL